MPRVVGLGSQSFEEMRKNGYYYVDKTRFIRDWWNSGESVLLVTRPRRFGKTLNMDMVECFLSNRFANRGDLFEGLEVWKDERCRAVQGTLPVVKLSFARVKARTFESAIRRICSIIEGVFSCFQYLLENPLLSAFDKKKFCSLADAPAEDAIVDSLWWLSKFLSVAEGKQVIILLDEYDTPLQEAWVYGYWD